MKYKVVFIFLLLHFVGTASAQWEYKIVDNGLDDPYKIAHCNSKVGHTFLKLENTGGQLYFYLSGGYFCDDSPFVEMAFRVGNEWKRFELRGEKSKDSDTVFIIDDFLSETELVEWFKKCSLLKVRINETYCTTDTYEFNMSKSESAMIFMTN